MKVLLVKDVPGLGVEGDVKDVAPGYARNYLLPQELVVPATPGVLKSARQEKEARKAREARMAARAEELARRISELTLSFEAKAGPIGRLYGSVTTAEIAKALERELGTRFDRRMVLGQPLREVGEHAVPIRISHQVETQVRVIVTGEGEEYIPPEATAEAPEIAQDEEAGEMTELFPDEEGGEAAL
ncbi:MAG: 50S ribosomal protein L9 [Anaerolineae bacterium]|nr:50S ribosomal protein L9 [Anaerolineae bacterium]